MDSRLVSLNEFGTVPQGFTGLSREIILPLWPDQRHPAFLVVRRNLTAQLLVLRALSRYRYSRLRVEEEYMFFYSRCRLKMPLLCIPDLEGCGAISVTDANGVLIDMVASVNV